MTTPTMEPIHPGEILMLDYLEPLGITQHRVTVAIGVPPRRINLDQSEPPQTRSMHIRSAG